MTGLVIGVLAVWAMMATVGWLIANSAISELTLKLGAMNLSLDKLEKHVQPLATLKATLDKERLDRERLAIIQDQESKVHWRAS